MPGVLLPQETEDSAAPSPMEVKEAAAEKEPEAPAARAVVGIIYPPPEVRSIQITQFLSMLCECKEISTRGIMGSASSWSSR